MTNGKQDFRTQCEIWYDRSASLVDSETIVQVLLRNTEAQSHIHRTTEDQRTRLICAFVTEGDVGLRKRAERLADCCKWPLFFVKSDGTPGMSLQRCRDRLCPVCSKIKGRQTAAKIQYTVQMMDSIRFITLTLMSEGKDLETCLKQLIESFRELRRSKVWKEHVIGGIWTIEIKPGRKEGSWNCHIHMLADGQFFDQSMLSSAWLTASGDSFVVDIRKVESVSKASWYIAKYVAKPGDFTKFSDNELCTYAHSVKGKRLLGTFGKLHSVQSEDESTKETNCETVDTISANKLRWLESDGFEPAKRACDLLAKCGGYWASAVGRNKEESSADARSEIRSELADCLSQCAKEVAVKELLEIPITRMSDNSIEDEPAWTQAILVDEWLLPRLMC